MRKLLMLGGAYSQVPAVKRAKELGYYVITCDYLPKNPGHFYSDQYKNISTTDKEKILEFAKKESIDGIIAYASDPSAVSAAYVCDALKLPGASYHTVKTLCEKDLFREFQKKNGFKTPWFFCIQDIDSYEKIRDKIQLPCIVKPVDSSGSKGVKVFWQKEGLAEGIENAMAFSRAKRVVIEQYIETNHFQLHGDGVVVDGQLRFLALGDQRFRESVPIGTAFPSQAADAVMERAVKEVERFIGLSGFECGGINVEIRISNKNEIYLIEIGPRTGGNYVPQLMELAAGVDEMTSVLKIAMGERCSLDASDKAEYCFQYIVGSERDGIFQELYIDDYMKQKVVKQYIHKSEGDTVFNYKNSNGVAGVILLKFKDRTEMEEDISNIKKHIKVILKEDENE